MKKVLIRCGVLLAVFLLGIAVFSHFMNIENTDRTAETALPSLPLVYIWENGRAVNEMYGYTGEMEANYVRDTVTLLPEDYTLEIAVNPFGEEIAGVRYEVRSADANRLVEEKEAAVLTEEDGYIRAQLPVAKLLEKEEEYILRIILDTRDREGISYYTRIVDRESAMYEEALAFCLDFSDEAMKGEDAVGLSTYLEPDSEADNSSFGNVTIHSSYRLVTWQGLNAYKAAPAQVSAVEIRDSFVSFRLSYLAAAQAEEETEYYNVTEFFRVRVGDERTYLLDYERKMDQIFMQAGHEYGSRSVTLGILDEAPECQVSENNQIAVFAQEGVLWSYNSANGYITEIYGGAEDITDPRQRMAGCRIEIADVDEMGSVDFIACGYMNRGKHEGMVGIAACHYDAAANTVEERVFIPYDRDSAHLELEMGSLAYVSRAQELYCMLEGSVYRIDMEKRTYEVVAEGLAEDCYEISEDGQMFAWLEEKSWADSRTVHVLNLETGASFDVQAAETERIHTVGFVGHDLVYGVANEADLRRDGTGSILFPMKRVNIVSEYGQDVKEYSREGSYVLEAEIEGNMIQLTRVSFSADGNSFVRLEDDQIINNVPGTEELTVLETFTTDAKGRQYRIVFPSELQGSAPQERNPREVLYEGDRTLELTRQEQEDARFYVYGHGRLDMASEKAGEAIGRADELQGVVINADQSYVWEKGNRETKVTLTGITGRAAREGETTVSVCLEEMLNYAGVYVDVNALLTGGATAMELLRDNLEAQVVDLSGCSLDAALYFVNRGVPVFAMKDGQNAVLIVGYDTFNTILFDPATGETGYMGLMDSTAMFEEAGNTFVSYIP